MPSNNTSDRKGSDFGFLAMLVFAIWAVVSLIRSAADAVGNIEPGQVVALIAVGSVAWFALMGSRAGHPPAQFSRRRPQLTSFWRTLSGSISQLDDVMLELGLFRRGDDGSTVRPTQLEAYEGAYVDWVRFTPVPGTATAWVRAMDELTFLFKEPLFLTSDVAGTFDMGYLHTAPPEPAAPIDHTEEPIWWDDVPQPEIGG